MHDPLDETAIRAAREQLIRSIVDVLGPRSGSPEARAALGDALLTRLPAMLVAARRRQDFLDVLERLEELPLTAPHVVEAAIRVFPDAPVVPTTATSADADATRLLRSPVVRELMRFSRLRFPDTEADAAARASSGAPPSGLDELLQAISLIRRTIPEPKRGPKNVQALLIAECIALLYCQHIGLWPGYSRRADTHSPYQRLCEWASGLPNASGWKGPVSDRTIPHAIANAKSRFTRAWTALNQTRLCTAQERATIVTAALDALLTSSLPWADLATQRRRLRQAMQRVPSL